MYSTFTKARILTSAFWFGAKFELGAELRFCHEGVWVGSALAEEIFQQGAL